MKAKFSPSPWFIDKSNESGYFLVRHARDTKGISLCVCEIDPLHEAEANAKLIALSPEMYLALKGCIREMWKHTTGSKALDDALRIVRKLDLNFKTP